MILLKDVTAYEVLDPETAEPLIFAREDHGGFAYRAARQHAQTNGGRIVAVGRNSTYDEKSKAWVLDELLPA